MWPLGHAAVAYLAYASSTRARFDAPPGQVAVFAVLLGCQFPDLLDKPLGWYAGVLPTGRSFAHSLLLLVPLSACLYLFSRRYDRGELAVAFGVGAVSHTLVDMLPALWDPEVTVGTLLWPLTSVEPELGAPSILELLRGSTSDPYFLLEFVLAAVAFAWWRRAGSPGLATVRGFLARVRPTPN